MSFLNSLDSSNIRLLPELGGEDESRFLTGKAIAAKMIFGVRLPELSASSRGLRE